MILGALVVQPRGRRFRLYDFFDWGQVCVAMAPSGYHMPPFIRLVFPGHLCVTSLQKMDKKHLETLCTCVICKGVLSDPVQPQTCCHVFCFNCMCQILTCHYESEDMTPPKCPHCRKSFRYLHLDVPIIMREAIAMLDQDEPSEAKFSKREYILWEDAHSSVGLDRACFSVFRYCKAKNSHPVDVARVCTLYSELKVKKAELDKLIRRIMPAFV